MKYELTDEVKRPMGHFAYRIRALKDFADVKTGDLGGFVSSQSNLSQDGNCWIYDDAMAIENSKVEQDATMHDQSKLHGHAVLGGNAKMFDASEAFENCVIFDVARLYGNSRVYGRAQVFSNAEIADMAKVSHSAWVGQDVVLKGQSHVTEQTTVTPINISGLYYNVTVMDKHISVDCVTKTREEWMNMSDRELLLFDGRPAVRFFNQYRDMLNTIALVHMDIKSNS